MLCLLSGGGSALLAAPAPGVSLADKRAVTGELLRSGATISEINCVRKHLSAVKGGRLSAAAWPARVETLAISDVPGDDIATIASGPTVADPTTYAEARAVLEACRIAPPRSVAAHLAAEPDETPKPGDARLARSRATVVTTPQAALEAAANAARDEGFHPLILSDAVEGEAREVAGVHAANRAPDRAARAACAAALRAAFGGRDDRNGLRVRPRRDATPSSCSRWRWLSTASRACMPLPATPTGSTATRTMPARSLGPTRSRAPRRQASMRARI